ncbi:LytTR family transcriptional regulator [Spirosoma taeanense]|uniref:LytTR family transcriptional regulator n=2 Tax=Spirosoma taeanense TaxID=2735870 RepID=A0A6M5YGJ2_9BACT|nr:LytTR family transcriptional regulator [Spirosoma taeanense]
MRLYVRETGRQFVSVANLVYLEADTNYCWLHWKTGQPVLTPRTLKYHHAKLPARWFIRLHRKCVVNRQFIDRLEYTNSGYRVHMTTGVSFPVSRRRWREVLQQMDGQQTFIN